MKTKTTMLLAFSCVLLSCGTRQAPPDVELDMLFDTTDSVRAVPTTDEILTPLGLKNNPYQRIVIRVSTISDKDINNATVLALDGEDEWSSNITIRRAKISNLQRRLGQCLDAIAHTDTSGHSIIYSAIIARANELAASPARRKVLAVYSNLYENNSDVNFYDRATMRLLRQHPAIIQRRLERHEGIQSLRHLDLCLIYNPANYQDNNHFMPIASLYERMFQVHGASVHVASKFQLQ